MSVNTRQGCEVTIELDLLRSKALFGGLNDNHLTSIATFLKVEKFHKNAFVIKEKEIGDKMYLITKGSVEVVKYNKKEGRDEPIAILNEGDSFGEMELVDIQPRTAAVKALTDLETVSFSNSDLLRLSQNNLEAFSIIFVNIARILSRKLRKMDEKIVSIHHG